MHLAEPEELGIDPSDRQTAAAVPVCRKTPSFITVTSVFYQIYYLIRIIFFLKTTWECLLEAFLNNCEIISSNRNNPGTIKTQTAINWKMQEHQHRCPQSEGADQERSLCSKLTSSSLNEIYSLAHGQAKSFMVFKRDKDWAVCNMFAVCLSPLCFLSLFTAPLAN